MGLDPQSCLITRALFLTLAMAQSEREIKKILSSLAKLGHVVMAKGE
jgi:hypothetical protein